jgi:Putative  PD-(D/E)XK family member, (DUF4420)
MLLRYAFAPRIALRALPKPTLIVGQFWMPIPGQCSMLIDARSLNGIVDAVQTRLAEGEAVEAFDRKLVAHGYAPLPEYDEPRFVVSDTRSYRVSDGFPRLMRSQLPTGIDRVAYDIRLEIIAPYECDGTAVFGVS